eukprot:SAG22_NODE_767_length_7375_cov_24.094055_6_plen_121_part_00
MERIYAEMPELTGSWSLESVGFEDHSGNAGVQILFGTVPHSNSAYRIPPSCHVNGTESSIPTCCSSLICQCEGVEAACEVDTSYPFEWVDLIDSEAGPAPAAVAAARSHLARTRRNRWCT